MNCREPIVHDESISAEQPELHVVIPVDDQRARAKAKSGDYLLPYRIPGSTLVEEVTPSRALFARVRPDTTAGDEKDHLRERFKTFDGLIQSNFKVLAMLHHLDAMPKLSAQAIAAEVGAMVVAYEALTRNVGDDHCGREMRAKYEAIVQELEELWKDLSPGEPLSPMLAERVGALEKSTDLSRLHNLHSIVNFMHQHSLKLLMGNGRKQTVGGSIIFGDNTIKFGNLRKASILRDSRLDSAPLLALLSRGDRLGARSKDCLIIDGNQAWYHAKLGGHSAEIYVNLAHADDGGLLRLRYEDWEPTKCKRLRLALLEAQLKGLGIPHEVKDEQFLTAVLDKDHGLQSRKQLAELFQAVVQAVHDDADVNKILRNVSPTDDASRRRHLRRALIDKLAEIYSAEGGWPDKEWKHPDTFSKRYDEYRDASHEAHRSALRAVLDGELARLGLPSIPGDIAFGQAVIDRYFTDVVQKALMVEEIEMVDGIPRPRRARPVEALADAVVADAEDASRVASMVVDLEVEAELEPIGAIGALRAERAILEYGDKALIVYGLRDPESGRLGYARVRIFDSGELRTATSASLGDFLREQGAVPVVEPLSGAQAAGLDRKLRSPLPPSLLSGERSTGLAASPGAGGFVTAPITFDRAGRCGSVMVVPFTTPDDIEAIKRSAAVVTTGGGLLSHAAITTRELHIHSVILPATQWKKDAAGKDYLVITAYEANGESIQYEGLTLAPRLGARRLALREGDWIRVNGATGEVYVFGECSVDLARAQAFLQAFADGSFEGELTPSARVFVLEEALFNERHRNSQSGVAEYVIGNAGPARPELEAHARRLSEAMLGSARAEPEMIQGNAVSPDDSRRTVSRLETLANVLGGRAAPSILRLEDVGEGDRGLVGGKLSKLGEILGVVQRNGAHVPDAIAVTTEAYRRFVAENGLGDRLASLAEEIDRALEDREQLVSATSRRIREVILSGRLDPSHGVGAQIWEAMQACGLADASKRLAIRSSAVQEDQNDAAFAGAAESYLHVRPEEALAKVVENWASFWLPRGILYRHCQGVASNELLPATIIQEMAGADVSGVIFTRNPVSGANEIVINAAYGLGEGIVSGIVQTDRYVTRKSDGEETVLPFVGDKRTAVTPKGDGSGTEMQGIERNRRGKRSLTLAQTQRLSLIAMSLEEHFGYPLDIEFAIEGERVAILQARPVTS